MPRSCFATICPRAACLIAVIASCLNCAIAVPRSALGQNVATEMTVGDRLVHEYFEAETDRLSSDVFHPGMTREQLIEQQERDRSHLAEMLGLEPLPDRTPLKATIVDEQVRDGFRFQRLHFQPLPKLYVAATFYLPERSESIESTPVAASVDQALPAILYVCGHARNVKDGISYGNKVGYHHHGVWFARNGYACLIIDTIQWGEFLGDHHGTYRLDRWWWNNRGYTPAGVEAWTGIRALDYLESRPEVDPNRIGITGRSGGGIYSWWIAALDQRVKVAVPVAGITTLQDYVVNGCVEGHCDCMFMINTYRWDYPRVAALLAPRPLLISNSDKDKIFPLEGVIETHRQVREAYRILGADDRLGLQITEGPHRDTQELRIHAFRWFNRFLKDDESLIDTVAEKVLEPEDLRVFDSLPDDEKVTSADEWFIDRLDWKPKTASETIAKLREKSFGGWPTHPFDQSLNLKAVEEDVTDGLRCRVFHFDSQEPYRLPLFVVQNEKSSHEPREVSLEILTQERWEDIAGGLAAIVPSAIRNVTPSSVPIREWQERLEASSGGCLAFFAPRGVGPTRWSRDDRTRTHIRRRFMLLGQTADAMRVWDVVRAVAAVRRLPIAADATIRLRGSGNAAAWTLFASLFTNPVNELQLVDLPDNHRQGLSLLNVSRIVELSDVVTMARDREQVIIRQDHD